MTDYDVEVFVSNFPELLFQKYKSLYLDAKHFATCCLENPRKIDHIDWYATSLFVAFLDEGDLSDYHDIKVAPNKGTGKVGEFLLACTKYERKKVDLNDFL